MGNSQNGAKVPGKGKQSAGNVEIKPENMRVSEISFLNLISEIIVEIIVKESSGRDRIHKKK